MLAPSRAARMLPRSAWAAARPASGLAPAPRPASPSWMVRPASERASAWRSVFTAMNSTPCTPRLTMWLTALPPPPPTPTTLMTAPSTSVSNILNVIAEKPPVLNEQSSGAPLWHEPPDWRVRYRARIPFPVGRPSGRPGDHSGSNVILSQKLPKNHSFMRRIVSRKDPDCSATLRPFRRCWRASSSRPMAVAYLGVRTTSERLPL